MSLLTEALSRDLNPSYTYEEIETFDRPLLQATVRDLNHFANLRHNGVKSSAYFANALQHFILAVEENQFGAQAVHHLKQTGYVPYLASVYNKLPPITGTVPSVARMGVFKGSERVIRQHGLVLEHWIKWRLYMIVTDIGFIPVRYQFMCDEQEAFLPTSDYVYDPISEKWVLYAETNKAIYDIVKASNGFASNTATEAVYSKFVFGKMELPRVNSILAAMEVYKRIEPTGKSARQIHRSIQNALNSALYHPDSLARQILNYSTTEKEKQK